MRTDTAHEHWDVQWQDAPPKWTEAEAEVLDWCKAHAPGSRILDLGAGVGRHALALARLGHSIEAVDAAPVGLAVIDRQAQQEALPVTTHLGSMTDLPLPDASCDHVLSWNVIYHGDETVVRASIAEIRRVLKPGGTFLGTMLSARRLPVEQALMPGREISRNTWVFDGEGDKVHPHYFCNASDLLELFHGFEPWRLEDREHERSGTWHWHLLMERQ